MKSLFVFIISALIAVQYCGAKTDTTEIEMRRLEMDIPSLYLVNGMFFSAEQTRQLADFLAESAKIHNQNQQAIRLFLSEHQKETDLLLEQMISGKKTFPQKPPLKGRPDMNLQKVRYEWRKLIDQNQHSLDKLAQKTLAILTPAQYDILDRFVPCFIPPGDFRNPERVGQADGDTSLGETMLARLRRAPEGKLNEAMERALDALGPYIMKEQHANLTQPQIAELRESLRAPLKELTDRVRAMKDSDFELEKKNLAKEFLCLQNPESGKPGGGDELGKIKRYLLNPGIASVIAQRAGEPVAASKADVTPSAAREDIKNKNQSFQAATLIYSLQLTAGQARQLLPCVQKAATARAETDLEAYIIYPQALKAYTALKKELENQQSSQKTEQEAGRYHHQIKMLYLEKLAKTLSECEAEMDRLLSADQVACLIGRQNGMKYGCTPGEIQKNISVVRARAGEAFDQMDRMSDTEFVNNSHNLCVQFVEGCLAGGAIDQNDIDKDGEIKRAEEVLLRARHLRRSEYAKAREDLIAEICPRRNKPRPDVFDWQKSSTGDQLEVVNENSQLILSPTGLTLLEKKIKAGN